jgi:hypothetical protein
MDIERTMEFILQQRAKHEEALARLLAAEADAERRANRLQPLLTRIAQVGLESRGGVQKRRADDQQRRLAQHEANFQRIEKNLAEATEGLKRLARKLA